MPRERIRSGATINHDIVISPGTHRLADQLYKKKQPPSERFFGCESHSIIRLLSPPLPGFPCAQLRAPGLSHDHLQLRLRAASRRPRKGRALPLPDPRAAETPLRGRLYNPLRDLRQHPRLDRRWRSTRTTPPPYPAAPLTPRSRSTRNSPPPPFSPTPLASAMPSMPTTSPLSTS